MPVADVPRIQFVQQAWQLAFAWNFFVTAPAFYGDPNIFRSRVLNNAVQAILYSLQMSGCAPFARFHRFQFSSYVSAREVLARFRQLDQSIGNWPHFYLAQMQDDKWRAESLGEINCLKGLFNGTLAFLGRNSRKLITIRRSHHHFDG